MFPTESKLLAASANMTDLMRWGRVTCPDVKRCPITTAVRESSKFQSALLVVTLVRLSLVTNKGYLLTYLLTLSTV